MRYSSQFSKHIILRHLRFAKRVAEKLRKDFLLFFTPSIGDGVSSYVCDITLRR